MKTALLAFCAWSLLLSTACSTPTSNVSTAKAESGSTVWLATAKAEGQSFQSQLSTSNNDAASDACGQCEAAFPNDTCILGMRASEDGGQTFHGVIVSPRCPSSN